MGFRFFFLNFLRGGSSAGRSTSRAAVWRTASATCGKRARVRTEQSVEVAGREKPPEGADRGAFERASLGRSRRPRESRAGIATWRCMASSWSSEAVGAGGPSASLLPAANRKGKSSCVVTRRARKSRFTKYTGKSPYSARTWRAAPSGTGSASSAASATTSPTNFESPSAAARNTAARSQETESAASVFDATPQATCVRPDAASNAAALVERRGAGFPERRAARFSAFNALAARSDAAMAASTSSSKRVMPDGPYLREHRFETWRWSGVLS
mmetsp:Transcript_22288/g.68797  ORF Transcript_22288/g.68797 Transcript_22288/m.68797 type:complete len:272 (-) Transcript_22288:1431-2246(-)